MPESPAVSKLGLALLQSRVALSAIARLFISPFRGAKGAPTYIKDVVYAALRTNLYHITLDQNTHTNPTTGETYLAECKARNFEPDSITLPSGTKAHWLGKRKADKLLIYFHGGGYTTPCIPGLMKYLFNLVDSINKAGNDITLILLEYDCAPAAVYPAQLTQAIELVRHMLENESWDPSNVILGGDSAGGNLTLAVLSHLLHPHPSIAPLTLSKPFHAAVLISPWVSFNDSYDSFKRNRERDIFYSKTLTVWSNAFLGSPENANNYSEPIRAPPEWWNGTECLVEQVLIWGGEWEVLIDSIKEFATKFEKGYKGKSTFLVTSRAAHEEMILDTILGYKNGESALVVEEWVRAKL